MAWDILPKATLQYFLTKLKNKFLMLTNYNKLGAKNILPFPYAYGSGTVHDLTVTVNDDGSITANGQPTQNVSFTLVSNIITEYGLQVGDKLIFSESNVDNDNASAALVYVNPSGPIDLVQGDYELTVTSDMVTKGVAFILWFHSGVDLSTAVTFKPMLRLDTDPDPTWTSPAFTNRKLTELVVYLSRSKSHVSANPSSTTGTLTSIEIDGTGYAVQGGGNVQSDWNETDNTADDYIKNKPTNVSSFNNDAGYLTSHQDISGKVNKSGDAMSGPLLINATNAAGNYDEGIRINAGKNGFSSLSIGGSANSTSGTSDGQFWIGTNRDNATYKRKLYIAHAGSTASETYFESDSASRIGPALHLGWSGSVADGNPYAVTGDVVYDYITSHMLNARPAVSGNMNDAAGYGNAMGMINLSGTDGNINPGGKTGWHHFINMSYSQTSGSNMWQTQLACQAGTTNLYIRSRSGGSISSAAWAAPWVRLAKATEIPSNDAVTQTGTASISSNNKWFRMLYSGTADDTTRTEGARKGGVTFNPWRRAIAFANTNSYLLSCETNKSLILMVDGDYNHGACHRAVNGDDNQWGLMPYKDGWLGLGHGSYRWGQIYSTNSAISTSDRNEKKDILPLDEKAKDFIMALNPVSFKFIDGKTGRTHYGMIAQDVEEVMSSLGMTDMDFAGFCKDQKMEENYIENDDGTKTPDFKYLDDYRYGLRYEEFIGPIIKTEQLQQEDINSLKEEVALLKEEIALLKQRLQILEDK